MFSVINYNDVKKNSVIIDVRSPKEFEEDTAPGAINIPLFNDEERALVGTTYVQVSKDEARRLGVSILSPKLPDMFEQIMQLRKTHKTLIAMCARGGYRSTFVSSAFSAVGLTVLKLEGGYKGYRRAVMDNLPIINDNVTYIVMHGNTGVGKTDILAKLKEMGCDVVDLEMAANHRGSLLGSIGIGECNNQKKFESIIYNQLKSSESKFVFIEAESKRIGKVSIPDYMYEKMKNGIHINVDADYNYRAKSLKKDYIKNDNWKEESINAVNTLRRYLSNEKVDNMVSHINAGEFEDVAIELMKNYYDPMYMYKANEYKYSGEFIATKSATDTAQQIYNWYVENIKK